MSIKNMYAITFIKILSMSTNVEVSTRSDSNKNTRTAESIQSHTPMFTISAREIKYSSQFRVSKRMYDKH